MVILFDGQHLPKDIFEIIFATEQQIIVAKLLTSEIKNNDGFCKSEMSLFATKLNDGADIEIQKRGKREKIKLSYNKRQFYDRIVTPMRAMGMLDYNIYKKRYTISDEFQNHLLKIGIMWKREANKNR